MPSAMLLLHLAALAREAHDVWLSARASEESISVDLDEPKEAENGYEAADDETPSPTRQPPPAGGDANPPRMPSLSRTAHAPAAASPLPASAAVVSYRTRTTGDT